MDENRIAIVGAGDIGHEIAQTLIDYARERGMEVIVVGSDNFDLLRANRTIEEQLRLLDICPISPSLCPDVYVLAAMQEEIEMDYIESFRFDVTFICTPNSDGITWFKQRYPRALVYSWQQAQDIDFAARLAPAR
jgi:saccharopine dehydrogenase-like NADP-dependent oxidoreductase